ncbi:lysozyme [Hyella patelloides]|nr:lysozyme [Hyella patelloides]
MNNYSHLVVLLTSISFLGCLPLAIATEQVSLDYENSRINGLNHNKSQLMSYDTDFSRINSRNVSGELNAIANNDPVTALLDEKSKVEVKTTTKPQSPLISNSTIALVKEFEGFRSAAYLDTDGTPIIGYGQSRIDGRKVRLGDYISYPVADAALKAELKTIQKEILSVIKVNLNSNQLGAVTSLAFNTGVHSIKKSTLVRKINQQDYNGAAKEFLRWDKGKIRGQLVRIQGLTRRRNREKQLFLTPTTPSVAFVQES